MQWYETCHFFSSVGVRSDVEFKLVRVASFDHVEK